MKGLRRRGEQPALPPTLAFCEHSSAGPTSPEHIRRVGPEGLKLGGGAPDTVLCGRSLRSGWDLPSEVTPERVRVLGSPRDGDGRVFLCRICRDEAMGILAAV